MSLLTPQEAKAQTISDCHFTVECTDPAEPNCKINNQSNSTDLKADTKSVNFVFNINILPSSTWRIFPSDFFSTYEFYNHIDGAACTNTDLTGKLDPNKLVRQEKNLTNDFCTGLFSTGSHTFHLKYRDPGHTQPWKDLCIGYYRAKIDWGANIFAKSTNGLYDVDSLWDVTINSITPVGYEVCTYVDGEWINNDIRSTVVDEWGNLRRRACNISGHEPSINFRLKKLPLGQHTISLHYSTTGTVIKEYVFDVLKIGDPTPTPSPKILPPACSSPYQCVRGGCLPDNLPATPNTPGYGICSGIDTACCLAPTPTNPDYCYTEPCTRIRGGPSCNIPKCQACNFCRPSVPPILTYTPIPPLPDLTPLCEQVGTTDDFQKKCKDCVERDKGMWTAIGCLPVGGLEVFLRDYLFTFGIGIAGGIAFLYFLYGTFLFLTSAGNAETVAQAKEIIVSALSGLLFIIFSILLLKIVGGDILRIPGFGP